MRFTDCSGVKKTRWLNNNEGWRVVLFGDAFAEISWNWGKITSKQWSRDIEVCQILVAGAPKSMKCTKNCQIPGGISAYLKSLHTSSKKRIYHRAPKLMPKHSRYFPGFLKQVLRLIWTPSFRNTPMFGLAGAHVCRISMFLWLISCKTWSVFKTRATGGYQKPVCQSSNHPMPCFLR